MPSRHTANTPGGRELYDRPVAYSTAIVDTLARSFRLLDELVTALPEEILGSALPELRSNTLGAQLWCVVGARESYGSAIVAGQWGGFTCSLNRDQITVRDDILAALAESALEITSLLGGDEPDDDRARLIVDLMQHEAQHQGQLIRYIYGLDLPIPDGWRIRWALS